MSSPEIPDLSSLLLAVRAPALVVSRPDGQLAGPAAGVYVEDRRIISSAVLSADRLEPESAMLADPGAVHAEFSAGTSRLTRLLEVDGVAAWDRISVTATGADEVTLTLTLACDLAELSEIRTGRLRNPFPAVAGPDGVAWSGPDGTGVSAVATPGPDAINNGVLSWHLDVRDGETATITVRYSVEDEVRPHVVGVSEVSVLPRVSSADRLVQQSLADLRALEACDPQHPADHFITAGAPWYLTLFGRDSLLTARMLLPLTTELAAGTLRTLARHQGTRFDPESAEEPGKIPHEIRRADGDFGTLRLPPIYYGTVDATPLWIMLLHDAWQAGLSDRTVRELLPNLERALAWIHDHAVDDGGFLRYLDASGHGLVSQGWKDSPTAVQFRDGRLAQAPIALSEVQGYAHAAAIGGAELLDAFGLSGAANWRTWAGELAVRFRNRFWVTDPDGDYPAIALDSAGVPVDSVASNMGHLLGTGLLTDNESALVAARLGSPELCSGFGLRTMATTSAGYDPLSYHCGSVWAHDTAIAISGLTAVAANGVTGAAETASKLTDGLLAAAEAFDYRLPELHGGQSRADVTLPVPYPAACRPQAWAAAAGIAIAQL